MSSTRAAVRVLTPNPVPGGAEARVAAVPRPGPLEPEFTPTGGTGAPSTAPPAGEPTNVGVHPSELAGMVPVPGEASAKKDSWPETDQPGKVFRESLTVTWF